MKNRKTLQMVFGTALLLLVVCLMPSLVFAKTKKTYKDYKYTYNEQKDGIKILKYTGTAKRVKGPAKINGVKVETIGREAFCLNQYVEEIVLPETVRVVEREAFRSCRRLKKAVLPKSLETLGKGVF